MKTVLITGANRGLGKEAALQLARKGFRVFVTARRLEGAANVVSAIVAQGGHASALVLDVSDDASIASCAAEFGKRQAALDVLINNAGIFPEQNIDVLTAGRAHMASALHTNSLGALAVSQAFLPYLRAAGAGARVVNVSSRLGQLCRLSTGYPSYCLSKLAMNGVTLLLANALKDHGIAVNSMCPGWVRTDMGGAAADLSVEEGVDTMVWLASEAPASLTGKFIAERREIVW